ncbi:MAG: uracil phosphoribosyltransferase [candidate division KSB1 bacterium]|nr:uracil phosphoribosyltransferase [candidate division KSB1 bacterium]
MARVYVSENNLARSLLDLVRDATTPPSHVRTLVNHLTFHLILEASHNLDYKIKRIRTPVAEADALSVAKLPVGVVILRAGLGMLSTFLQIFPQAQVGFLGIHRDEATFRPVTYYQRLPARLEDVPVFVLDPMLATGGTACACLQLLRERGARNISFLSLVGAPEGVKRLSEAGDVNIYLISLDQGLDERGYIVPGLGDAGDRLFPVDGWPEFP